MQKYFVLRSKGFPKGCMPNLQLLSILKDARARHVAGRWQRTCPVMYEALVSIPNPAINNEYMLLYIICELNNIIAWSLSKTFSRTSVISATSQDNAESKKLSPFSQIIHRKYNSCSFYS